MENKTGKYFKYAIGEIALVVIGILIALQINTWNENRKEKLEENFILQNINDEFSESKKILKATQLESVAIKNAGFLIMDLFGKPEAIINQRNADSLLFMVLESGEFRPNENTISDLIQSGRLKLLQNKKLKTLLYQWQKDLKSLTVSFNRVELKVDNELIPYLSKNYALRDIDKYGNLNWKKNSTLQIDKYEIFNDIEFENITDDYLYRVISAEIKLNEIENVIDAILTETKYK
ncbi:DUF6090 family protein [Winogradskyella sp. UBA3174]|uniref:DUF6090 family protein n=1 Tax=Winogradskyella sp. UBA3174 TaxID=1947785 RepID=UPI0025EBEA34|nr:DUF6090 family protein [Winogradskyella sp. UBA3174]|tara:strand:- start:35398 stop:36102 length:705 start_codon:yes stop_codon:yes gene_type:complete